MNDNGPIPIPKAFTDTTNLMKVVREMKGYNNSWECEKSINLDNGAPLSEIAFYTQRKGLNLSGLSTDRRMHYGLYLFLCSQYILVMEPKCGRYLKPATQFCTHGSFVASKFAMS